MEPDACLDQELAWRKEMRSVDCGKEILKTMTYFEASEILQPLLSELITTQKSFDRRHKKLFREVSKEIAPDTFENEFVTEAIWIMRNGKAEFNNLKRLVELEKYWKFNELRKVRVDKKKVYQRIAWSMLIEKAKQVQIEDVFTDKLRTVGSHRKVGLCPFHEERTPSFMVFTDSNTFHCFGCDAHGDVIEFYSKTRRLDFKESVKLLAGY